MILSVIIVLASIPIGFFIGKLTKEEVQQGKIYLGITSIVLGIISIIFLFQGWASATPYLFLTGLPLGSLIGVR